MAEAVPVAAFGKQTCVPGQMPGTEVCPPFMQYSVGVGLRGVLGYLVIFMPNFFIAPGLIQKLPALAQQVRDFPLPCP